MKYYQYTIIRPGGNDTCLIDGIVRNLNIRKRINDAIMTKYPNVEQVGFIDRNPLTQTLIMAGGEFCGNATRSTAWLALNGKPGVLNIRVSGVKKTLKAGVLPNNEAFAQMPIYPDVSKITKDGKNRIIEMEGITHYINFNCKEINRLSPTEIKQKAMKVIRAKNLDRFSAAGVMWSQKYRGVWRIKPVVYVRKINTLFLETACASGSVALGLVLAQKMGSSINNFPIIQPTGLPIRTSVAYNGRSFTYAQISGPVEILQSNRMIRI